MFETLLTISAAIIAVTTIFLFLKRVFQIIYQVGKIHNLILSEFQPNGGSSLRDAIHRIDKRVEALEQKICDNNDYL